MMRGKQNWRIGYIRFRASFLLLAFCILYFVNEPKKIAFNYKRRRYNSEGSCAGKRFERNRRCYVVARLEMSGASHSLTLARPLRIRQIDANHWTVDGTPTDCVTLALNRILPAEERPHICVSGINHGANLGDDATYSGTVAGAMESTILGVAGLAFNLSPSQSRFRRSAKFPKI